MASPGSGSRSRGRLVLVLMGLLAFMYLPLWMHCRLQSQPPTLVQTVYVPSKVPASPCPLTPVLASPSPTASAPVVAPALSTVRPAAAVYHMRIVVFTYRRLEGLKRLLKSLEDAWYLGHDVSLTIYVDFPKKDTNVAADDGTRRFVSKYRWPHGTLTVHRRLVNAGLKRTIMESWYPSADSAEVTAFFEDDIEVSPFWYVYQARALQKYAAGRKPPEGLLGISLFRPIHDELSGHGCAVDPATKAFALQQPCSWGAVFLPGPWREFRDWYDDFNAKGTEDPTVQLPDGSEPSSNTWARSSSWKKYLIKLMVERGWFMVYPNPPEKTVLSTNHLMKGEHPTPSRKLFELPLLLQQSNALSTFIGPMAAQALTQRTAEAAFDLVIPPLQSLKVFDVMFREVPHLKSLPKG